MGWQRDGCGTFVVQLYKVFVKHSHSKGAAVHSRMLRSQDVVKMRGWYGCHDTSLTTPHSPSALGPGVRRVTGWPVRTS